MSEIQNPLDFSEPKLPKQCQTVFDYMKRCGAITPLDAFLVLGVTRLSARVFEIRKAGHRIDTTIITVLTRSGKARVAQYSITE